MGMDLGAKAAKRGVHAARKSLSRVLGDGHARARDIVDASGRRADDSLAGAVLGAVGGQRQPFDVAVVDAGGRYHSWPLRSGVTVELDDPLHQHLELLHTYNDKDIHDLFAYLETLQ